MDKGDCRSIYPHHDVIHSHQCTKVFASKDKLKPQKFHSIKQLVHDPHADSKSIEDNFALNDKVL